MKIIVLVYYSFMLIFRVILQLICPIFRENDLKSVRSPLVLKKEICICKYAFFFVKHFIIYFILFFHKSSPFDWFIKNEDTHKFPTIKTYSSIWHMYYSFFFVHKLKIA